jgi:hypothetical protein
MNGVEASLVYRFANDWTMAEIIHTFQAEVKGQVSRRNLAAAEFRHKWISETSLSADKQTFLD